ncbi:hypothetical protein C8J57DRAFT_1311909 [Mycena rebaudengoi]|nr:hypothetical protein C8J57DRAFT_1311909 [Mycena rebaudengoi]
MTNRTPYTGLAQKLVLGIDIGTTFGALSFCILEPGRIPTILPVTHYPAQAQIGGDAKIPSIIYYDNTGRDRASGAEALQEDIVEKAKEEGWEKSSWFKLHLRPQTNNSGSETLPPLPSGKSATEVFADFLRYLFHCARSYIQKKYPNGGELWISLEDTIEFVLTHPNGWEGRQQENMRYAAIIAGLISDSPEGHERIHFVTEGEASLHFCINNGLATDPLRLGKGIVIVDAGGGTVDISTYRKVTTKTDTGFEEITLPRCLFAGSIYVRHRAQKYITYRLQGSKWKADVEHITDCFDKTAKLLFRGTEPWSFIKFGRPSDRDEALNITGGQWKLPREIVELFFKPSLDAIVKAIEELKNDARAPLSTVLLVGGFGASDWLYSQLGIAVKRLGLTLSRPDSHVNKAVADGAVSFYLDRFVGARISRYTIGVRHDVRYDARNVEHRGRPTEVRANGVRYITDGFSTILRKNTRITEATEFRGYYYRVRHTATDPDLVNIKLPIFWYTGEDSDPKWLDTEKDFETMCNVIADTRQLAINLEPKRSPGGRYYQISYDVVLSFGLTELKAQIAWKENGEEKRGPARIMYD